MMARNLALSALMAAAFSLEKSAAFVAPSRPSPSVSQQTITSSDVKYDQLQQSIASSSSSLWSAVAEDLDATTHGVPVSDSSSECITQPRGAANDWEVHKFGGASLATADLYRTVGDLLIREAQGRGDGSVPTMA